jgi:hypothetical protein
MTRFRCFALAIGLGFTVLTGGGQASAESASVAPAAAGFQPVTPVRVLDTRSAKPVGPGRTITLDLSSRVPETATAVVLNVTGAQPTTPTSVTVFPRHSRRPTVPNLELVAGETRSNLVTVGVGEDRKVSLYNNSGSVHLIADLSGYYSPSASGKFTALALGRMFDTRSQSGARPAGPIGPGVTETIDLTGRVPASATAVTFNLTGTQATANTFTTVWPSGPARPDTVSLSLTAGATTPNLVTVALGADRKISVYNDAGDTHLFADLAGFYTPDYGAIFTPVTPKRVLDTTSGNPVQPQGQLTVELAQSVPANTTGVVLNVTGTQATADTFVTVWSNALGETRPFRESNLNLAPGQTAPNLVAVGVGARAGVSFYNNAGTVHLIADLVGYFSLPPVACTGKCVYAWGANTSGILGTGTHESSSATPQPVYGLSNVKAIAGGYALRTDGTVWAWGTNGAGELGNGWGGGKSVVPVPVLGLTDITAIDHGIALKADGTVWAWGLVPPANARSTPVQVPGLTQVTAVAASGQTAFAVRSDGTAWAWGDNHYGALGTGAPVNAFRNDPEQIAGLTDVRSITAGGLGALALKNDGTLWSWGINREGELGTGIVGTDCLGFPPTGPDCYSTVPVQVGLTGVVATGNDSLHGFAVKDDGTAWAWGYNGRGGLGNGVDCQSCVTGTPAQIVGPANARAVKARGFAGYLLDADGRVWAWGQTFNDQLGPVEGTPPPLGYSTVALRLSSPVGVSAIAASTYGTGFALVP